MPLGTGTANDIPDLFTQLATFAQAHGWTKDSSGVNTERLFLHHTASATCYTSFRWDSGAPQYVGIYHALGYINSSTAPGSHTNDSGQGVISGTNATIGTGRHAKLTNAPMPYWFFQSDANAATHYIHCVAQVADGECVHFGFGAISKVGDLWTGGEYAYGSAYKATDTHGSAVNSDSSYLLDGLCDSSSGAPFRASLHIEGIPGQAVGKWGVVGNFASANAGTDRGATARTKTLGGFRGGAIARAFGRIGSNNQLGLVPIYPIAAATLTEADAVIRILGEINDVGGMNIQAYELGDTMLIGADTWYVFPTKKKSGDNVTGSTYYSGIAYRVALT